MTRQQKYLTKGTLKHCLNFMFSHWRLSPDKYLSILAHEPGRYHAVVNDDFLNNDQQVPEMEGSRLMLRVTIAELTTLCTYYKSVQMELPI